MPVRALKPTVNQATPAAVGSPTSARILVLLDADRLVVDVEGGKGPVIARYVTALSVTELRRAIALRQAALVVFEQENPMRPIVVALAEPSNSELLPSPDGADATPRDPSLVDVRVDGKHLCLEAREEMVLRCGKASISLFKNGKIVIRGAYVETHASGTNRIKGA